MAILWGSGEIQRARFIIMGKLDSQKKWNDYFKTYYKDMVGDFTERDFQRNRNWFSGWIKFIEKRGYFSSCGQRAGKKLAVEIGCSIGAAASLMVDHGFDVVATEVSSYAIDNAKRYVPMAKFELWDIQKSFEYSRKADLIYGFEVIEHVPDTTLALKNMYKALKKGGCLILSTPFVYDYVKSDPTHVSVKEFVEWKRELKDVGFKTVRLEKAFFIPLLYRYSAIFSRGFSGTVDSKYINSTQFLLARK